MAKSTDPINGDQKAYTWRHLLSGFWRIAKPYWTSKESFAAWSVFGLLIALALTAVYISVELNYWKLAFWDAMQKYDVHQFWPMIVTFTLWASCSVVVNVSSSFLTDVLKNRWRRWMTRNFMDQWLSDKSHYLWQLSGHATDNPDQRLAEDVRDFVSNSMDFFFGILSQLVTLVSFIVVLWVLSGVVDVPLGGGRSYPLPGFLVWGCLLYALLGTLITHLIGKPLITLNFRQQHYEANYRFGLVRLRENGESVALSNGEGAENSSLKGVFERAYLNFYALIRKQLHLDVFSASFDQASVLFPILLMAPRYFAKLIGMGAIMQGLEAFTNVNGALSWVVDNYSGLAGWSSIVERLDGFEAEVRRTKQMRAGALAIVGSSPRDGSVLLKGLSLSVPGRKEPLFPPLDREFKPGTSVLITGPSGCGKSTFMRAVSGVWPFSRGHVLLPEGASVMVIPQKPYLPVGSLRGCLAYPAEAASVEESRLLDVLALVHLGHLNGDLDVEEHWGLILSVGEQQRVAWARVFLHAPQWLFLDEATSALDEATQESIYRALKERLPGTTMLSVAHAHNPAAQHQSVWNFGSLAAGS